MGIQRNMRIGKNKLTDLADTVRYMSLSKEQKSFLALWCSRTSKNFNTTHWLNYIDGKCGPNGGRIRMPVKPNYRIIFRRPGLSDYYCDIWARSEVHALRKYHSMTPKQFEKLKFGRSLSTGVQVALGSCFGLKDSLVDFIPFVVKL
jgi:hypothetical protein